MFHTWGLEDTPYRHTRRGSSTRRQVRGALLAASHRGLGDYQSDCENTIRSYSPSYVFAGSRLRWSGSVSSLGSYLPGGLVLSGREGEIKAAVQGRGYYDVRVDASKLTTSVSIDFSVPVDQSSRNDVQANIEGAIQAAGYNASGSINVLYAPSAKDICKGVATSGQGSATGAAAPPPPDPSCGFFCQLTHDLAVAGISGGVALAIGLGVGVLLLTRK